jgi:hypothetical protein
MCDRIFLAMGRAYFKVVIGNINFPSNCLEPYTGHTKAAGAHRAVVDVASERRRDLQDFEAGPAVVARSLESHCVTNPLRHDPPVDPASA